MWNEPQMVGVGVLGLWMMLRIKIWSACTNHKYISGNPKSSPKKTACYQSGRNQMAHQLISDSRTIPISKTGKWACRPSLFWVMCWMYIDAIRPRFIIRLPSYFLQRKFRNNSHIWHLCNMSMLSRIQSSTTRVLYLIQSNFGQVHIDFRDLKKQPTCRVQQHRRVDVLIQFGKSIEGLRIHK